jgi:hypothetical protein
LCSKTLLKTQARHGIRAVVMIAHRRSGSIAVADPFGFNIDPTLAKSLRDDCDCVFGLGYDLDTKKAKSADERADIMKERERISASISERARTITCPVGYGPVQAREDSRRADRSEATERSRRAYQSSILFSPRPTRKPQAVASTNFSAEHSLPSRGAMQSNQHPVKEPEEDSSGWAGRPQAARLCITIDPLKNHAPLIVDPNREKSLQVSLQLLQPI